MQIDYFSLDYHIIHIQRQNSVKFNTSNHIFSIYCLLTSPPILTLRLYLDPGLSKVQANLCSESSQRLLEQPKVRVEVEPSWEIDSQANEYNIDTGMKFDAIMSLHVNDMKIY